MPNVFVTNPIRLASTPISAFIVGGISLGDVTFDGNITVDAMPDVPWAGSPNVTVSVPVSSYILGSQSFTLTTPVTSYVTTTDGQPFEVADQSVRGWIKADKANSTEGGILAANGRYSADVFASSYISVATTSSSSSPSLNIADASYQAYPKQLLLSIQASATSVGASGLIIVSVLQGDGGSPEIWHGSRNLYTQAGMVDQSIQSLNADKLFTGGIYPGLNGMMSYQLPVNSSALLRYDLHGANLKLTASWTDISGTANVYARWILIY